MTWRRATITVLFSPVTVGLVLLVAIIVIWKLPMICCERLRAVRWLPLVGLCYYAATVPAVAVLFELDWLGVVLLAVFVTVNGGWLPPDPVSFVFSPTRRRAVKRAIEFVEREGGPRPLYGWVSVIGRNSDRLVVSVAIDTACKPPNRRFLAVVTDGTVEELDTEFVADAYGVQPWF